MKVSIRHGFAVGGAFNYPIDPLELVFHVEVTRRSPSSLALSTHPLRLIRHIAQVVISVNHLIGRSWIGRSPVLWHSWVFTV